MTSSSNTAVPNPNAPTLASRTSQLRTALIAALVATCLFFLFFLGSIALQHRLQEGQPSPPVWFFLLGFGFLLAPYIISWLLLSNREQERIAAGAGVACGFFGAFVLVSPYAFTVTLLFVGMSAWNGPPNPGMVAAELTLLVYMVMSLWIVWSAFRIGKVQWSTFGAGVGATAFYLFVGFELLIAAGNQAQQQAEHNRVQANMDLNKPAMLAGQTIVSLTACLLRNHMLHPEADYPATLNPHPADWACDTNFAPNAFPGFTLEYEPLKDAATGRVTDFQLTAMPDRKGIRGRDPVMIDGRGIIFVDYPWDMEKVTPKVMVQQGDFFYSQIEALKRNIEQYMKEKNNRMAPATLNAEAIGGLGHERPTIEDGGMRLETRDFETLYLPPEAGNPGQFALSVQCKSYGQNCLRSYFADYDGSIHATGEPRQATSQDPTFFRCERFFGECPDIIWDPI
ncbi:MAG: hypothetical protein WBE44_03710 [Terriglobales bacterium]|jgi:hypothetical protein